MNVALFLLTLGLFFSPPPLLMAQTAQPVKYWIFLQDKPAQAAKATAPDHLSERTLQRRARRGQVNHYALDTPLDADYMRQLESTGIEPLVQSRWLNAVSAYLDDEQHRWLKTRPWVREIRPVGVARPTHEPLAASPVLAVLAPSAVTRLDYGASATQLEIVNAIEPLEAGINGTGVRLGVIDTGFGDLIHPAFINMNQEGRVIEIRDFTGQDDDRSRHGFSVLSVAAGYDEGKLIGPAHGVEFLGARTEYTPTETTQEEDNFVAGLEWMEAEGVDVVNVSLSYTTFDDTTDSYTYEDMDGKTAVTTLAAETAVSLGVVMVSSAGNDASCGSPERCWYYIGAPADGASVITVGAVRSDSVRASFSSFGPTADGRTKPDVVAMGQSVYLARSSGYGRSSGTSFSGPMVAGIACQILQVNPDLSPLELRDLLRNTAHQSEDPDNALGWGIVDAKAAIDAARPVGTEAVEQPMAFSAVEVYPNPFSGQTNIEVRGPRSPSPVRLSIFNALGQRVATPIDGPLLSGSRRVAFNASHLPSGLYLYVLETDTGTHSGKLVHIR